MHLITVTVRDCDELVNENITEKFHRRLEWTNGNRLSDYYRRHIALIKTDMQQVTALQQCRNGSYLAELGFI